MKRLVALLLVALALGGGAGSCRESTGPVAGMLTVSLTTPNAGADDAMLFTITGPEAITTVTAGPGVRVFTQPLSTATRLAVTGALANGAVVTIGVADTRKAAQYAASIQAVATPAFQLRTLTGYSLRVAP
jgi:hypothetical protein